MIVHDRTRLIGRLQFPLSNTFGTFQDKFVLFGLISEILATFMESVANCEVVHNYHCEPEIGNKLNNLK